MSVTISLGGDAPKGRIAMDLAKPDGGPVRATVAPASGDSILRWLFWGAVIYYRWLKG